MVAQSVKSLGSGISEGVDILGLNIQIVSCIVPNVFHFKHIYVYIGIFILFVFAVLVGCVKFLSLLSVVNYVQILVLNFFFQNSASTMLH